MHICGRHYNEVHFSRWGLQPKPILHESSLRIELLPSLSNYQIYTPSTVDYMYMYIYIFIPSVILPSHTVIINFNPASVYSAHETLHIFPLISFAFPLASPANSLAFPFASPFNSSALPLASLELMPATSLTFCVAFSAR
jgi:hypothetical protein